MHTTTFEATEANTYGADDAVRPRDRFSFNYHGDLSGEVVITQMRPDLIHGYDLVGEFVVPAEFLLEFVGQFVRGEFVNKLDDLSGKDTLRFLIGDAV